jgi:hypothetical protein
MSRRLIEHADPGCVGGWSALVEDVPSWVDRAPASVELICWVCGRTVRLAASTPATGDPDTHGYESRADVPGEHRPGLAGVDCFDTARSYPASVDPVRVATGRGPDRVVGLLHIDAWLSAGRPESAYLWLVTDLDGNQLGVIAWTATLRGADRYDWGSVGGAAGHGGGFHTPVTAARALLRAVYAPRDSAPDGAR